MPPRSDDTPTTSPASPWLTPREAAARAKCGRKLVYYAIKTGRLKAARLGARNDIRIHADWLDAWVERAVIINPDAPGANVPLPIPFKK